MVYLLETYVVSVGELDGVKVSLVVTYLLFLKVFLKKRAAVGYINARKGLRYKLTKIHILIELKQIIDINNGRNGH